MLFDSEPTGERPRNYHDPFSKRNAQPAHHVALVAAYVLRSFSEGGLPTSVGFL